MSIQAFILCEKPWYNEPGREYKANEELSHQYNTSVRNLVIRYAILPWVRDEKLQSNDKQNIAVATPVPVSIPASTTPAPTAASLAPKMTKIHQMSGSEVKTMWMSAIPPTMVFLPLAPLWREIADFYFPIVAPEIIRSTDEFLKTVKHDQYGLTMGLRVITEAFQKKGYLL